MSNLASEIDQLLRIAIKTRRLVRFRYGDKERVVEPHDYGVQNGRVRLLGYQIAGASTGRLPGWRWMNVDLISDLEVLDRTFKGSRQTPTGKHHQWEQVYARVGAG